MARSQTPDVVIVGGGIAGIATAYYLGRNGVRSLIVERDAIGSHASGFAYGGIGGLSGPGVPGPGLAMLTEGMRLHRQLAEELPVETGVETDFRDRPTLSLAFSEEEAKAGQADLGWQRRQLGYSVNWLDRVGLRSVDRRISPDALGGLYTKGPADLDPYKLVLAMAGSSERRGASIRHGGVTGLTREKNRITGVVIEKDERVSCRSVVLAMGPWTGEASPWLGVPTPVRPLKGQILRLRARGAAYECSVGWAGHYATTKPDGLVWAGTTEEEAGFDENTTESGRDEIMAALLRMLPSLAEAQLVRQTACLRPLTPDRMPILGRAPDWEGVYLATGAGRQGVLLAPAMGRITADLIVGRNIDLPMDAFAPGRFAQPGPGG